ncbi:RNA ligase family protein [Mycobacterium gordonae]|uniref:ATP-dependent DNA ligase n=1 Tax=Mycobacterium gordonae TaxID=1778 RepID=UPI0009EB8D40|nr:RNA ligase family protein [Mycobacterium gordonae]
MPSVHHENRRRRQAPAPMLATLGDPPVDEGWSVEWKFDGQRGLIVADQHGDVAVYSRNGALITRCFPDVAASVARSLNGRAAVLDGEIVVVDADGRPDFGRLQQRWPQNRRPSTDLLRTAPALFYAFDVLAVDGIDTTGEPYTRRRELLEDDIALGSRLRVVPRFDTRELRVVDALAVAAEHRMEGVVSKRLESVYRPGRSTAWLKTCCRVRSEFLIGGWLPGGANRKEIGALIVGAYDDFGRLAYCGTVGAGLSAAHRRVLHKRLSPLASAVSPFATAVPPDVARFANWVRAEAAGDVEYRELRGMLRHPSWKGLRADLDDVTAVRMPADARARSA